MMSERSDCVGLYTDMYGKCLERMLGEYRYGRMYKHYVILANYVV